MKKHKDLNEGPPNQFNKILLCTKSIETPTYKIEQLITYTYIY